LPHCDARAPENFALRHADDAWWFNDLSKSRPSDGNLIVSKERRF
jgi:hypothetical protein